MQYPKRTRFAPVCATFLFRRSQVVLSVWGLSAKIYCTGAGWCYDGERFHHEVPGLGFPRGIDSTSAAPYELLFKEN